MSEKKPITVRIKTSRDRGGWAWRVLGLFGEQIVRSRVNCATQQKAHDKAVEELSNLPAGLYKLRKTTKGKRG